MRSFAPALAAVFIATICAPVAALLVAGVTTPYGAAAHIGYPSLGSLLAGREGAFDRLGQAIRERSPLTPAAISLKNATLFDTGAIDAIDVIMGRNGWFFFKDDFWKGRCLDRDALAANLASVDVIGETARAGGMEFVFAMAPDKSGVYPDKLDPMHARIWNCKRENSTLIDRLLAAEVKQAVNHRQPLVAARRVDDSVPLYYRGDTHWTTYGIALGVRQLLAAIFPDVPPPPAPKLSGTTKAHLGDMANGMLLLPTPAEQDKSLMDLVEQQLDRYARADTKRSTVILHDSFYEVAKGELRRAFPHALYLMLSEADSHLAEIQSADRLVVERVERAVPDITKSPLGWKNAVGIAVLARNHAAASQCIDFRPVTGPEIRLSAEGTPCLRIKIKESTSGTVDILLSRGVETDFELGRSISETIGNGGAHLLAYVLPSAVAGHAIRINVDGSLELKSMEVGRLPR